jgi:MFS family permease
VQTTSRERLYYGWVIVTVTALVLITTAGVRSAPGAFLLEMERDTGWSKAVLSFATALGLVLFGLGGPISGTLMNRFGVKRITLTSLVITAAAMILSSRVSTIWQLDLFFWVAFRSGHGLGGERAGRDRSHALVCEATRAGDRHFRSQHIGGPTRVLPVADVAGGQHRLA